jgi:hypothetical protein
MQVQRGRFLMKTIIIAVSEAIGVIAFLWILGHWITMSTTEKKVNRPQGHSEFLYKVAGCDIYRIEDGNGENKALLSKCPTTSSVSSIAKDSHGRS